MTKTQARRHVVQARSQLGRAAAIIRDSGPLADPDTIAALRKARDEIEAVLTAVTTA